MRSRVLSILFAVAQLFLVSGPARAQHEHHEVGDPKRLGKVEFANSCAPVVQEQFSRALALLHSFWYERSAQEFSAVSEKDPSAASPVGAKR